MRCDYVLVSFDFIFPSNNVCSLLSSVYSANDIMSVQLSKKKKIYHCSLQRVHQPSKQLTDVNKK